MNLFEHETVIWLIDTFFTDNSFVKIKLFCGVSICLIIFILSLIICLIFSKKKRIYPFIIVALLCGGFLHYQLCPTIVETNIHLGLKKPIKVVQLTDFHENTTFEWVIKKAISLCNKENPDIVVLTGDYETSKVVTNLSPTLIKELSKIKCDKKYSVFGNHDNFLKQKVEEKKLKDIGIIPVHLKNIKLDENLYITGIDFKHGKYDVIKEKHKITKICKNDPMHKVFREYVDSLPDNNKYIFLCHVPRYVLNRYYRDDLFDNNKFFFITGHTHGGQIIMPKEDRYEYAREKFYMDFLFGERKILGQDIYVSKGIGSAYFPFRLNAKPEVSVFNID